jgi:hypothetical protein
MATETKLKLEAPEVLNPVQPQDVAGLVPLKEEERPRTEAVTARTGGTTGALEQVLPEGREIQLGEVLS